MAGLTDAAARAALSIALCTGIGSCGGEEKPQGVHRRIGEVLVKGSCLQDHANVAGEYEGSIVHWYKVSTAEHFAGGFVTQSGDLVEDLLERAHDRHAYYPPFSVDFRIVSPEILKADEFVLHGVSKEDDGDENEDEEPEYHTTCNFRVVKRTSGEENQRKIDCSKEPSKCSE